MNTDYQKISDDSEQIRLKLVHVRLNLLSTHIRILLKYSFSGVAFYCVWSGVVA